MAKSKQPRIVSIDIDLGDKTVELSLDQAKELHRQLGELFADKAPTYIPSPPVFIERDRYRPYWNWPLNWRYQPTTTTVSTDAIGTSDYVREGDLLTTTAYAVDG